MLRWKEHVHILFFFTVSVWSIKWSAIGTEFLSCFVHQLQHLMWTTLDEWIKLWYVSCCWGRHPYIYTHTRKPTGAKHGRLLWFIVCTNDRLADRHLYIGFMISAHLPSLWEIARETFHAIFRSGLWQRLCAGSQSKTFENHNKFQLFLFWLASNPTKNL